MIPRNVKTASFRTENWRFWSEWRDSNSRHPGPKELMELFPNLFCSFLVLSAQVTMLSGTLQSAVSTCSRAVYGQKCGQILMLPERCSCTPHSVVTCRSAPLSGEQFAFLRCRDCSLEWGSSQVLSCAQYLGCCKQRIRNNARILGVILKNSEMENGCWMPSWIKIGSIP